MKTIILIRKSDSVVIHSGNDLALTDSETTGNGWRDPHFTTENAHLADADLPEFWTGAVWSYVDGVWSIVDPDRHAQVVADAKARGAAKLDTLRAAKNDEINAERERRTFGTFGHEGKAISCDTLSRSDIDGINGCVALNGAFPAIWPGVWKCADNTYLEIATIDEWKAFYGSMVAAGSALYAHAQELKAQLATATTADEITAIHW